MDNILLLKGFNNYYNRIIKYKFDSIYDYPEGEFFGGINFVPKDGINTELIIGGQTRPIVGNDYDYLVVFDENTQEIKSRWYILEALFITKGQYRLQLRRDLITDYFDSVKNSTAFISRGLVSATNPLIFNREDMTFNQIKKSEHLLKDSTQCGWIVGYVAPDLGTITDENGVSTDNPVDIDIEYSQETIPDISLFPYIDYVGKTLKGLMNRKITNFGFYAKSHQGYNKNDFIVYFLINKAVIAGTLEPFFQRPTNTLQILNLDGIQATQLNLNLDYDVFDSVLSDRLDADDYFELYKLNNRVYNDNGIYKKVVITPIEDQTYDQIIISPNEHAQVYNTIISKMIENGAELNNPDGSVLPLAIHYSSYKLTLETVGAPLTKIKATFKKTNKRLLDAPYKMFCIPYNEEGIQLYSGNNGFYINKERQLQMASSIATGLGANLYDIQLLPYCPMADKFFTEVGALYYEGGNEDIDFTLAYDDADQVKGIIFWCEKSNFTTNISELGELQDINVAEPIEFKIGNETNLYRLCSPNYANFEDINIYMNYGVDYINIDCTYKPITPYIKLNINYKGLYGADFNDSRGLILAGDFSLPIMSDAWINYQIQNKNYSNIFDREMLHLETAHKWNVAESITGAISGTVTGAGLGAMIGGGAGAVVGGALSAVGGGLDIGKTIAMHGETMDFKRDTFKMNLQNIQALPQGLVKTSAFNYNSKIYPFIEYYTSTEEEKTLLRTKLHYTSMTLNVLGTIKDYLSPDDRNRGYLQARLIRIDLAGESHIAEAINEELSKGVYI